MKTLLRCAAALYPSAWRARYGAELDALIEDTGGGWLEFVDICKGAMKMQIVSGGLWRFASACGLTGLLIAGVAAWRTPSEYQSIAVLRMAPAPLEERLEKLTKAEEAILSRRSLAAVIQKYDLYPEQRKRAPLEEIVQNLRNRQIQIRMLTRPQSQDPGLAFSIAFNGEEPRTAQAVTGELTSQFVDALKDSAPLEVLDPASLPQRAFSPNRPAWLAAGLLLGMAAGLVLLGIRRWPLIPLAGLLVAAAVLPATYLIPDQFRSVAVLRSKAGDPGQAAMAVVNDRAYLQSLIAQFGLYPKERNALERMQRSLAVKDIHAPIGNVCLVSFDYPDRYRAQAVLKAAVGRTGAVELLDPPSLPERAFTPNRLAMVMAGLFAGLVLGGMALAVRRHRTPALVA
ncbi:MAG: hypothetical protein P4L56_08425 [Candidatus Sulfopaludibacter sp.]|nr:hypothetical protein [Candidatus Sulfopaludibacter sp.]